MRVVETPVRRWLQWLMWTVVVALGVALVGLMQGCGGDMSEGDAAHEQLGEAEQGLSAKFSPTFTMGVGSGNLRGACTVAAGPGPALKCRLPITKAIKYKFIGADPFLCPQPGCSNPKSWIEEMHIVKQDLGALGLPGGWTFAEVSGPTISTVAITHGTCSGDAATSNNIQTFVCSTWTGVDTAVTESFPGSYFRWSDNMLITVDTAKITTRAATAIPGCNVSSQQERDINYHQILEHGMYAAVFQAMGGGTNDLEHGSTPKWNVSFMQATDTGQGCYDMHQLAAGDLCRVNSYNNGSTGSFTQASGSCAD